MRNFYVELTQGSIMSSWLFNVYMIGVVKEVKDRVDGLGSDCEMRSFSLTSCSLYCCRVSQVGFFTTDGKHWATLNNIEYSVDVSGLTLLRYS